MATVQLDRVSKRYSGLRDSGRRGSPETGVGEPACRSAAAVDEVSLSVDDRELMVLVGPSGCGKSTTLRLIAGLETCDSGEIRIGGRRVNEVPAKDRDLAMVFQSYALYPHMSVYKNLSFGLELRSGGGFGARVLRRIFHPARAAEFAALRRGVSHRVQQAARRLGIDHLLGRRPHELSGGERQRVALGRAIVRNPAAFLFDEPLSNLDAQLRTEMRSEIRRLQQELQATMIYVTHDQVEAMTLGDRIAVMNRGRIEQIGAPREIYLHPANRFVAEFIGASPMNFVGGAVVHQAGEDRFVSRCNGWTWPLPTHIAPPGARAASVQVTLGIRPEHVTVRPWTAGSPGVPGRVVRTDWLGDAVVTQVELFARPGDIAGAGDRATQPPRQERERGNGERCEPHRVLARSTAQDVRQRDEQVAVEFDPERIVWFDPDSGANLRKDRQA